MTPILQLLRTKDEETNLKSRKNITFPTGENNPNDSGFQKPQRHKEGMTHLAKCRKEKKQNKTQNLPKTKQATNKTPTSLRRKKPTQIPNPPKEPLEARMSEDILR